MGTNGTHGPSSGPSVKDLKALCDSLTEAVRMATGEARGLVRALHEAEGYALESDNLPFPQSDRAELVALSGQIEALVKITDRRRTPIACVGMIPSLIEVLDRVQEKTSRAIAAIPEPKKTEKPEDKNASAGGAA